MIVNWLQTTRESRTVDQSYRETLGKIMNGEVNTFLKSMVYTPLAEQNKIAAKASNDQCTRGVWYNQAHILTPLPLRPNAWRTQENARPDADLADR